MRKLLTLLAVFSLAFSLNVSVSCNDPCLVNIPLAGHAQLNMSVNGSQINGLYRSLYLINITGELKNNLVRLNLSGTCDPPAEAHLESRLDSAYIDSFLFFFANLTSSNQTFAVLCNGYTPYSGWLTTSSSYSPSPENTTFRNGRWIIAGLSPVNSTDLHVSGPIESGNGTLLVANSTSGYNLTLLNSTTLQLVNYTEVAGSTLFLDQGRFDRGGTAQDYYAISHGNLTLLNYSGAEIQTETIEFNGTRGVAFADIDGDGLDEILICANTTAHYNLTLVEYSTGWQTTDLMVACPSLNKFDPINLPGYNESAVTFNDTGVIFILFNQTTTPSINYTALAGVSDLTAADVNGDGRDEIIAVVNSVVNVYEVNSNLHLSLNDSYGNATFVDSGSLLAFYNGTKLETHNLTGGYPTTAVLTIPLQKALKVTVSMVANGNVTANVTAGSWSEERETVASGPVSYTFYPLSNETALLRITLEGDSPLEDSWMSGLNVTRVYTTRSFNASSYSAYSFHESDIKTTIHANSNFTIVNAEFKNATYLESAWLFFGASGQHEIQMDGPLETIDLWKPSLEKTSSSVRLNGTPIHPDQQMADFLVMITSRGAYTDTTSYEVPNVTGACSNGNHVILLNGSAILLEFNGTFSREWLLDGNFTSCWIREKVYLLNSTGYVKRMFLNSTLISSFYDSSFTPEKMIGKNLAWNGTHVARLDYSTNRFTLISERDSEPYGITETWNGEDENRYGSAPLFDFLLDGIGDVVNGVLKVGESILSGIETLVTEFNFGFNNKIASVYENGTAIIQTFDLSNGTVGNYSSFETNATDAVYGYVFLPGETYRVNVTVEKFIHNATSTVNEFNVSCENSTFTSVKKMDRYGNHSFTTTLSFTGGRFACKVLPVWETDLPATFKTYPFTACVEDQAPTVNSLTLNRNVSVNHEFNVTVNVTEDCWIETFSATIEGGSAQVLNSYLVEDGAYQLYNVTLKVTSESNLHTPLWLDINATDYAGNYNNKTESGIVVYDADAPSITLHLRNTDSDGTDYVAYSDVPVNVSITTSSDANLTLQLVLWKGAEINETETREVANGTHLNWYNKTLTAYTGNYTLQVIARDITGVSNERNITFKRTGSETHTLTGKWYNKPSGAGVTLGWEYSFQGDDDESTNTSSSTTFSTRITHPDIPVDWYVKAYKSDSYVKLYWEDSSVSDVKVNLYANGLEWGFNTTGYPDYLRVYGSVSSIGDSEKLCMYTCKNYNLASHSCSEWALYSCGNTGNTHYIASISKSSFSFLFGDLEGGGGIKFVKTVEESQQTSEDQSSTTTSAGGTAITLTAPTQISIESGGCTTLEATLKNTGSGNGTVYGVSLQGSDKVSYTLTSVEPPFTLYAGDTVKVEFEVCSSDVGEWEVKVCSLVGGTNFCSNTIKVKVTQANSSTNTSTTNQTVSEKPLNISYVQEGEMYRIMVNSTDGPVSGATVKVLYPDGSMDTFTTNELGMATFKPKSGSFSVFVQYQNQTKVIDVKTEIKGPAFTIGRILIDVLVLAILFVIGAMLDERLI